MRVSISMECVREEWEAGDRVRVENEGGRAKESGRALEGPGRECACPQVRGCCLWADGAEHVWNL